MLRSDWVDRIFDRLQIVYGDRFLMQYGNLDRHLVKADWAHELSGFSAESIKHALDHLPENPPNVLQFRNECRRAPLPQYKALPAPKADPERVSAELRKINLQPQGDPKDWARRILARVEIGEKVRPLLVRFAKEALQ